MKEPSHSKARFARCRKRRLVSSTGAMALALACAFPSAAWADDYVINSEAELQAALATIAGNADSAPRIILGSSFSVSTAAFALPDKPIAIDTRGFVITTPAGGGMDIAGPTGSNVLGLAGTFAGTSTGTAGAGLTLTGTGTVNSSATITSGSTTSAGATPGIALGLNGAVTFVNNGIVAAGDSVSFTHPASGGNAGVAVSLNSGGTLVNNGLIQGSNGQNGSDGFAVYARNLSDANFIVNNGTIRGGSNADLSTGGAAIRGLGPAAMTLTNNSGGLIEGGNGSAAILGFNQAWGVSVINSGTIAAGAGGANAIDMGPASGSTLTLELRAGSVINGNVVASTGGNDILRFGGAVDATFDMANVGATGQFRNFDFLSKTGSSTWTLTGDGTIGNAWNIAEGTLAIGDGGTTGPTFTGMLNNATLEFRRSTAITVNGFVNGTGRVIQSGAGTTTLTASSGYSGGTLITGGVLQFGFDGAIGTGGVTVDGGTLRFTGSAAGTTRTTTLGANGGTFDIATAGSTYTASGFTGAGALTKLGAGTLILNGDNSHTGGTTIGAGSLRINGTIAGNIVDNGTLIFGNATTYTHAGSITGTGNVTAAGSALLTLTGNSSFGGTLSSNGTGGLLITNGANVAWGGATTLSALDGSLSVTGGSIATSGGATTLGRNTLLIDGTNSVFSTTALSSSILGAGSGIVNVANGGTLRLTAGNLTMRALGGGTAISALRISGMNSLVDVSGGLLGANAAAANIFEATISAGATLRTAGASQIGIATSTQPLAVTITGAGSNWTSTGSLAMTAGTFTLDQGGAASFASASFGASGTPTTVSVTGIGSSLATTSGDLVLGSGTGIGSLDLSNGGSANIAGSLLVGAGSTVALSGGSARVGGNLVVGTASGNGALTLANGSSVDVTGNLVLGTGAGMGELVLASGNTVNVGGSLILADNTGATGILSIGAADGSTTPDAPGAFTATTLAFGSAGSILNFNHDAADYVFAAAISGAGTINQRAGDTNLTGDSSVFTGITNVSGGRLRVNGTLGDATSAVNVLNGGTLGGAGTVGGSVSVDDGTIAPGNSPGTLTIAGNLSLTGASLLDYEFGHSDVVGGPLNDLTQVGGDLTLDGTINVTVTPGGSFDPGLYRVIGYAGSLTDNGLAVGTVPGGSLVEVQTSILGQVNLVNHAGIDVNFWDGGTANDGVVSGGSGLWQGAGGNSHWTLIDGTLNTAYPSDAFAIFSAAAGTVTVDASLGAVNASGLQFASDGYVITGDAIGLTGSQSVIRVGDGTTAGAGFTATIAANLTGAGDLFKTDLGTLVLTGSSSIAGDTYARSGLLQISGGGTLSNVNGLVGPYAGDQATVTVTGVGSAWNNSGDLWVGYDGTGTLNVTNGGQLTSATGTLGVSAGSIGNAVVSGAGSSWQNGGRITLGLSGTGNLRIEAGATVSSDDAIVGESTLGNAVITGAGSSWSNAGQLTIGSYAAGTLRIEDGATVTSNQGYIGAGPGSDGNVIVTGAGSSWQVSAYNIIVGHNATGSLAIENGALVHAGGGVLLGTFAGSSGTLTMQGTAADRAVLETSGIQAGLGTVNLVLDGALLRATADTGAFFSGFDGQDITLGANGLAFDTGSHAIVASPNFIGAGGLIKDGAGVLVLSGDSSYGGGTTINAGILQIGAGGTTGSITGDVVDNGDLSFNRSDAVSFGGLISGSGSVTQFGPGTLTLTGTNSYTGATNVGNDGTLLINGDQSAATGLTTVAATATLGGTGIIGGSVDMSAGGTLAPGRGGAGTLTILGGLTLSPGSTLAYEFGAANSVGNPLNDVVNVGGNLVLDGTINVSQTAGGLFDVGVYRVFNYGGTLVDNGLALGALPAGSHVTVQTSIAGQVNLVNSAGLALNFWDGAAGPKSNGTIDGGNGVWQSGTGNDNWANASGTVNGSYSDGAFAVFGGTAGTVTVDDSLGQVAASGMQFTTGGYTITGGAIALAGAQSVIRVGDGSTAGAGYVATINAPLTGPGQLVKTDAGTLVLGGANTYAGGTLVTGGTVQIASDANLGAAPGSVTLDGGTLSTSATFLSSRSLVLQGVGTLSTAGGTIFTLAGPLSGAGDLTKAGTGTLVLNNGNAGYAGATRVTAGTLAVVGALGGTTHVDAAGRIEGTGTLGTVVNSGTIAPGISGVGTLTLTGNYTGVNGTLEIEAALGGDGARADRLVVGGSTAGTTLVKVINLGGMGAPTVQGIKIIDVTGASNGVFTLEGDYVFEGAPAVIAGAYGYRLYKNGVATPTDGDWYLRSALLSPGAPPETPLYQPGVPVYEAYGQTLATLNAIGTMQERVGNRRWSAGSDGISGIWGRMESARSRPNAVQSTSLSRVNVDSWKVELGVDQVLGTRGDGSTLVVGVLGSYGEARANIASPFGNGSIKTRGYGAGATISWFGPQGFYADGRAQFTWFDSDLKSGVLGRLADGNHGTGQAYGIEVGKRSPLSGKLSVTPQIQMVYSTVGFDRFTDPNGAEVSSRIGNSLKTRWGISLDRQDATSQLYGVVNLSYEWLDGTETQVSGTPIVRSNERFWGELGLGGSAQLGRVTLYSQFSANTALRDFGKSYSLKGIAGLRLAF